MCGPRYVSHLQPTASCTLWAGSDMYGLVSETDLPCQWLKYAARRSAHAANCVILMLIAKHPGQLSLLRVQQAHPAAPAPQLLASMTCFLCMSTSALPPAAAPLENFRTDEWVVFERSLVVRDIFTGGVRTFLSSADAKAFRALIYTQHGEVTCSHRDHQAWRPPGWGCSVAETDPGWAMPLLGK